MGCTAVGSTFSSLICLSSQVHWGKGKHMPSNQSRHRKLQIHVFSSYDHMCVVYFCNRSTSGADAHTYRSRMSRAGLSAAHGVHIQGIGHCSYHMNTHSNLSNGPSGGLSFGTGKCVKPGYLNHNWSVSWVFLAAFRSCRQGEPCCW